jgi:hypothetical protein
MSKAVKKTISLPADLARDAEARARAEGKTLSAVVQDALRQARIERRLQELRGMQGYWSRKARDKGILTEQDLERYLPLKVVFDTNILVSALVFPGGRVKPPCCASSRNRISSSFPGPSWTNCSACSGASSHRDAEGYPCRGIHFRARHPGPTAETIACRKDDPDNAFSNAPSQDALM